MERQRAPKLTFVPFSGPAMATGCRAGSGATRFSFRPDYSPSNGCRQRYLTLSCFFPDVLVREAGWDGSRWNHAAKTASLAVKEDAGPVFAILRNSEPAPNSFVAAASRYCCSRRCAISRAPVLTVLKAGNLTT